ncbi:MAG: adenosylmethionine--8-amino-7-oxononanoate transaminase [Elusimicrobiota bacterium]
MKNFNRKKLEKIDKKHLWHPFTQMQDWVNSTPLIIESADGVYLKDTAGKKYLDGVSSLWVNLHGHRKKEIDRAIQNQLSKIAHSTFLGLSNVPAIELAEKLVALAPANLQRVFYSDNGSTAVEVALKMAFQYWQLTGQPKKNKFLTFVNAYHGDTIGSVSLGGIDIFHKRFGPLLFSALNAPSPYCYRCPWDNKDNALGDDGKKILRKKASCQEECLRALQQLFKQHHAELAAVIIEPLVQAAAGILVMPKNFLRELRRLCSQYNVLLIADEVAVGFGRTGTMFACEQEKVNPDFLCLAKGITGGYLPLAVTMTTEKIYSAFLGEFQEKKTFFHGHTYTANPLGCAAGLANLEIFRKEKVLTKLRGKISFFQKELEKFHQLKHVGDIRQIGLIAGIELVKNKTTKESFPDEEKTGINICQSCRQHGLILRPLGDVIVILPPLSITQTQLKKMLSIVYQEIHNYPYPQHRKINQLHL